MKFSSPLSSGPAHRIGATLALSCLWDKTTATVWQTGSSNDFYTSPYQWLGNGDRGLLYVSNDGVGGQSGSPVYVFVGGQRVLVGVLIGSPPEECQEGRLWAPRLTPGTV